LGGIIGHDLARAGDAKFVRSKAWIDAEECDEFRVPLVNVWSEGLLCVTALRRVALRGVAAEFGHAVITRGAVLLAQHLLERTGNVEGVIDDNDSLVRCGDELDLACLREEDELFPDEGSVAGTRRTNGAQSGRARAARRGLYEGWKALSEVRVGIQLGEESLALRADIRRN